MSEVTTEAFSQDFWKALHKKERSQEELSLFISDKYLALVRNFFRMGWITSYLFGASPAIDKSYIGSPCKILQKHLQKTLYAPYGTSLRLSEIGYYSRIQCQNSLSFNDYQEYLKDLRHAITTSYPTYENIEKEKQLNTHILQIEGEQYGRIRLKPLFEEGKRVVDQLEKGVEYVEVRTLDNDPRFPLGIDHNQLFFVQTLLLFALFKKSPPIEKTENKEIFHNQNNVAFFGRKPDLTLSKEGKPISLKEWGGEILEEMAPYANLLDEAHQTKRYSKALSSQKEKIEDPSKTPSAQILKEMKAQNKEFVDYTYSLAQNYKELFLGKSLTPSFEKKMEAMARKSLEDQRLLEHHDQWFLKGYEDMELSTQLVIREAQKRGITVSILDRAHNFISLEKGAKKECLVQATKTSKDSIVTYALMESKDLSKKLLEEKGFSTPIGNVYKSFDEALNDYSLYQGQKVVVKPNQTNFGLGIFFIEPGDKKMFAYALQQAFALDTTVLVETFIPGEDYRFLVINGKCVAICQRRPASVLGDGIKSIKQLINAKNKDPYFYKTKKDKIRVTPKMCLFLKEQKRSLQTIPQKGERIYLYKHSNVSIGGDSLDVTGQVPQSYQEIAVKAASLVDATFCGVDMIIADLAHAPTPQNHAILELNFNPALYLHKYAVEGKGTDAAPYVLDALVFYSER